MKAIVTRQLPDGTWPIQPDPSNTHYSKDYGTRDMLIRWGIPRKWRETVMVRVAIYSSQHPFHLIETITLLPLKKRSKK